ncbi:hypothetical protein [Luteimonas sp. MHLX1A]|uniref:hypothetical protein n=1 Tax=Alterluteimonas muca TaxID=2878684 RepID=UPI001E355CB0|nr:hypothetical protein [Luteimonas sp. MHLX1A]MCD9046892.1 hypothetical protein [Luteimonas sp. MHLX1A]
MSSFDTKGTPTGSEGDPIVVAALRDAVRAMCMHGQTPTEMREGRLARSFALLCKLDPHLGMQMEPEVTSASAVPMIRPEATSESPTLQAIRVLLALPDASANPSTGALADTLMALATPGYGFDIASAFSKFDPETRSLVCRILAFYGAHGPDDELFEVCSIIVNACPDFRQRAHAAPLFSRARSRVEERVRLPGHPVKISSLFAVAPGDWHALLTLAAQIEVALLPARALPSRLDVDPALPSDFDGRAHTERDAAELEAWWDVPYALTQPDGSFRVRCLDGGTPSGSSDYGTAPTVDDALSLARDALSRVQQGRTQPRMVEQDGMASIVLDSQHPQIGLRTLVEAMPAEAARCFLREWQAA